MRVARKRAAGITAGVSGDSHDADGDGRRRYNIEFTYIKDEPVTLGKLYAGNAHLCQVHYHQIAGFKPKILKEGAAFPPIYADFADIPAAGAPNGDAAFALRGAEEALEAAR